MDFQELKDIIHRDGGKIIIVENDKPQLVVMSFEEYKKKSEPARPALQPVPPRVDPVQKQDDLSDHEIEGLTIDDLPLS